MGLPTWRFSLFFLASVAFVSRAAGLQGDAAEEPQPNSSSSAEASEGAAAPLKNVTADHRNASASSVLEACTHIATTAAEAPAESRAYTAYSECKRTRPANGLLSAGPSEKADADCKDFVRLYMLAAHYGGTEDQKNNNGSGSASFCGEIAKLRENEPASDPLVDHHHGCVRDVADILRDEGVQAAVEKQCNKLHPKPDGEAEDETCLQMAREVSADPEAVDASRLCDKVITKTGTHGFDREHFVYSCTQYARNLEARYKARNATANSSRLLDHDVQRSCTEQLEGSDANASSFCKKYVQLVHRGEHSKTRAVCEGQYRKMHSLALENTPEEALSPDVPEATQRESATEHDEKEAVPDEKEEDPKESNVVSAPPAEAEVAPAAAEEKDDAVDEQASSSSRPAAAEEEASPEAAAEKAAAPRAAELPDVQKTKKGQPYVELEPFGEQIKRKKHDLKAEASPEAAPAQVSVETEDEEPLVAEPAESTAPVADEGAEAAVAPEPAAKPAAEPAQPEPAAHVESPNRQEGEFDPVESDGEVMPLYQRRGVEVIPFHQLRPARKMGNSPGIGRFEGRATTVRRQHGSSSRQGSFPSHVPVPRDAVPAVPARDKGLGDYGKHLAGFLPKRASLLSDRVVEEQDAGRALISETQLSEQETTRTTDLDMEEAERARNAESDSTMLSSSVAAAGMEGMSSAAMLDAIFGSPLPSVSR